MPSNALRDPPRTAAPVEPSVPPAVTAGSAAPRTNPIATCLAIAFVPLAAAVAFHALTAALPFNLEDETVARRPEALPPLAAALARLLGHDVAAWRVFGACALGAFGISTAALFWRMTRSRLAAVIFGGIAATHTIALLSAGDARKSFALLATAAAALALAICGRRLFRLFAALLLFGVAAALWPRGIPALPGDMLVRLGLNRAPGTALAGLTPAAIAIVLFLFGLAKADRSLQARFVACGAAAAIAAMGVGSALQQIDKGRPARVETQRFLGKLDAVPPVVGQTAEEVVLDAPIGTFPQAYLGDARPARHIAGGIDATANARQLRILHWAPPQKEGMLSTLACEIAPVIDAAIDHDIALHAPAHDRTLPARSAKDEPEFRFSFKEPIHDLHELRVVLVAQTSERTRVEVRELEDATVQREGAPDAPAFVWRPGWRPMAHAERELRWEDGDVCPRGGTLWWTVAVVDEDGVRMAPFRRLYVEP